MILHHLSLSRVSLLCVLIATHAAFADIASTNYVANNYVPNTTGVTHTANTAVGNATQPVYIASDGKATATTYTLGASVPSDAKFTDTDTTYTAGTGIDITNEEISVTPASTAALGGVKVGDRLGVASDGTLSVNYVDTLKKIGTDTSYKTHNKVVTAQAFLNGWHRTPSAAQVKSLLESTSTDKENTIPSMSAAKTIAEYVIGNPTTNDANEVLTVNTSGKVTPAKITTANFDVYDSDNNPDGALTTSIQYDPTNESDARIPTAKAVAKAAQNATQLFYMNYVTPTMVWHDANTAVGSATQPVYIASNGEPTATTYTLGASVPSNADFSDTKVTQSAVMTSAAYPILFAPSASPTSGTATTAGYGSGITINPSTKTITATTFDGKNLTLNGTSTSRGTETFGAYTDTTFANGSTATFNGTVTVPTPTADTHAANKAYVDSKVSTAIAAIPTPTDNDTKNTTGATTQTTATKLFLVGSVGQTAEEETHTNSNAYVDTAGALNSVTPASGDASTKTATTKWVSDYYQPKGNYFTSHQTIKQDGVTGATVNRYGTCSTAGGTAAKTASITTGTFSLETGAKVTIKFANKNTAASPTLAVNSTAAKAIYHNGSAITAANAGLLNGVCDFVYDGTNWNLVGNYVDTNTTYALATVATSGSYNDLTNKPTIPVDTDTKNTTGSTDTSSKIFLVGATSQAANPVTYSNAKVYVDTDNRLTVNGTGSTALGGLKLGQYSDLNIITGALGKKDGTTQTSKLLATNASGQLEYIDKSTFLTTDSDTKNTTGAGDTSSKIYLVGATERTTNPVTYSYDTAFVDTAGAVNSVTPASGDASTKTATTKWVSDYYQPKGSYLTSYTETDPLSVHDVNTATKSDTSVITFVTGVSKDATTQNLNVTTADVKAMTGATSQAEGTTGLVPAPAAGANTKFLRGDGTWVAQTTYSALSDTELTTGTATTGRLITAKLLHDELAKKANTSHPHGSEEVTLSGYSRPVSYDAVGDGDTVTAALGKLEAGLWEDRERITAAEDPDKIDGVTADGRITNRYGVSATAAATAAKTVSITKGTFSLETGARVTVKFTNANTAASPTLNVNGTGAKNVYHGGAQITTGANKALLAGVCDFVYDGTGWALVGNYYDSTITGGASTIATSNLTANQALVSNASGKVAVSAVTATELGYLSGLTSNAQTQITNALKQVCVGSSCSSTATMYIE